MNKLRALFVVQLKAMLFSFRPGGRSKKRAASGAGILALMAGLACYLSVSYSILFSAQLSEIGQLPLLLVFMPVMAVLVGFFFTLFAAQGDARSAHLILYPDARPNPGSLFGEPGVYPLCHTPLRRGLLDLRRGGGNLVLPAPAVRRLLFGPDPNLSVPHLRLCPGLVQQ